MPAPTTEPQSIFDVSDPVAAVAGWLEEAAASEPNDPNAMALATVDAAGMPNVRIVLLKEIEADAFVFYTNYDSAKGTEIAAGGKAAFCLHWKTLRRQVRVRGTVTREDGAQADRYYASRDLGSRLGAWASPQSRPIADRAALLGRVEEMRKKFGASPPRPPFWGGFRVFPLEIELWQEGENRLHDRELWTREAHGNDWYVKRLSP